MDKGPLPFFQSIDLLPGTKGRRTLLYKKLMGGRVLDALWHLPTGIEVREKIDGLREEFLGKTVTLVAKVNYHEPSARFGRPYRIVCDFGEEQLELLFFNFRGQYLKGKAIPEKTVMITGKLEYDTRYKQGGWRITHPDYIGTPEELPYWVGSEPIYPLTAGITGPMVRRVIKDALAILPEPSTIQEWIDPVLLAERQWPSWTEALRKVHNPQTYMDISPASSARGRLAYDELLAHQLSLRFSRRENLKLPSPPLVGTGILTEKLKETLPFSLTPCQLEAIQEISHDLNKPLQMLRLLQGDVGSGKTLVAVMTALQAIESGYQAAILAPTDILARQHYATLKRLLEPLGISVAILTAREKGVLRRAILTGIEEGNIPLLIGTHAIIQDPVTFKNLGLAVVDEQHRFGVEQRAALCGKGYNPHILSMTATPIPRTLQLANYGDMEVSILREKPPGRQPIVTSVLSIDRLDDVITALSRATDVNQKVYWVCPLIEESENLDLAAVTERYAHLSSLFEGKVALIHGKMKSQDKERAMESFANGDARILIATTVIEVGVDVPSATIMVIEHAERFGLAQLHQLRGRVGRGEGASNCLLLYGGPLTPIARKRLQTMRSTDDGFKIAEADLRYRGSGEILGTRQSGLPKFRFVDLINKDDLNYEQNTELLSLANQEAKKITQEDPDLKSERGAAIRFLLRLFGYEDIVRYKQAG